MNKISIRCDFYFNRALSQSEQNELVDKLYPMIESKTGLGGTLDRDDAELLDLSVEVVVDEE